MEFDEFAGDRQREIELGHCYVAHVDAEVIGYVSVEPRGLLGQAFLTYLCVPKKHRGKGVATGLIRVVQGRAVGRKLLSSTEQWCVQMQHILRITVTPAVRNARKCATQNASKPPVMGSSVDGETPYCRSSRHPQRLQGSAIGQLSDKTY